MLYHGFYVEYIPTMNIPRKDKYGNTVRCFGYEIRIFTDSERKILLTIFMPQRDLKLFPRRSMRRNNLRKMSLTSNKKHI